VIEKCTSQGIVFGPLLCCIAALTKLYLKALEFADPAENIRERSNLFTTTNTPILADDSKRQRKNGDDAMSGDDVDIGRFLVSKRKRRRDRRRRE